MKPLLRLLTELSSHKFLSQWLGYFAKSTLSKRLIPSFINAYKIDADEAEKPLEQYQSLNEFFTRRLKPGARPLAEQPNTLISPVDAKITGIGKIEAGTNIFVKGQQYEVAELLNHSPRAVNYRHGYYIVLYLSPSDYHRIHAPISGNIVENEHIPGKVYPVNGFGLRHIPKVLSRNERLITYIQHDRGELAIIKVGAMNVSSIQLVPTLTKKVNRGEEMAYFEFGSTVVLLTEKETFIPFDNVCIGDRVRMGEALGTLTA